MRVSVEATGTLGRRMTVTVPADEVEAGVGRRLKELSRTARMDGFRPGKVPMKIIEARYGGSVITEVARELIDSSLREAIDNEGLRLAGGPTVEPRKVERGQDLEYVVDLEIYPEVASTDIAGMTIERPVVEVSDDDVEQTIDRMRRQRVEWDAVERAAEAGDRVLIDFEGRIDGELFQGGEASDYPVVLGERNVLPQFEEVLPGASAGDEREAEVPFPPEYPAAEVAGKTATFTVRVKEVSAPRLPEVDEAFAQSFGIPGGDVARLRAEVRANMERELGDQVRTRVRARVFDALLERNSGVEMPTRLIEGEIDRLIGERRAMMEQRGMDPDAANLERSQFENDARRRVALGVVLGEVVRRNEIKPDSDRVRSRVEQMALGYDDPEGFVRWYYSEREQLAQVEALIVEEQAVEHLLTGAEVVEKPTGFRDFMLSGMGQAPAAEAGDANDDGEKT